MRISVDIPGWARERHIYVLAGSEPVAVYLRHPIIEGVQKEGWTRWVKTRRCNLCGKCCIMNPLDDPGWPFGYQEMEIDGRMEDVCGALRMELRDGRPVYICMAGPLAPWGCIAKNPPHRPHPDCVIEYERR